MRIVVCAKQVPEQPERLDPHTTTLMRLGRPVLDDADAVAVELAVRLATPPGLRGPNAVDDETGDDIVLVSMAPGNEVAGLRTGLALGATRGVVVSDPALAGSDALTTAKVLAAVVRGLRPVDLVLAATESTDGYTGVLPSQLAELLGLPAVTFARRVELTDGELRAERQTDAGHDEVVCPLPCLVTVTSAAATPRYPSFRAIVGAKSKPVEVLDLAALGVVRSPPGQEVVEIAPVEQARHGAVVDDDGHAHERILDLIAGLKLV